MKRGYGFRICLVSVSSYFKQLTLASGQGDGMIGIIRRRDGVLREQLLHTLTRDRKQSVIVLVLNTRRDITFVRTG